MACKPERVAVQLVVEDNNPVADCGRVDLGDRGDEGGVCVAQRSREAR